MRSKRIVGLVFGIFWLSTMQTLGQVLVNDDFESYTNPSEIPNTSLNAVWVPTGPADTAILTIDDTLYPGIEGQAVDSLGGAVNVYTGPGIGPGNAVIPTAEKSLFVSYDLYEGPNATGGRSSRRFTLGLRNSTTVKNILELGLYNSSGSCDPTVAGCGVGASVQNSTPTTPGYYPGTVYAARMQLFGGINDPLTVQPDWQYFQLPIELDRPDPVDPNNIQPYEDQDTLVNLADVGKGWHTYTATIRPDCITLTIDLFRDGFKNTMRDENGPIVGMGEEGVPDAIMHFNVSIDPSGFDSLRIGGPSNVSLAGQGVQGVDNVLLQLIDAVPCPEDGLAGDHNGDGFVNAADYPLWRDQLSGDLAGYTDWKNNFGDSAGSGSGLGAAVPEPASLALAGLALIGLLNFRRSR